MFGIATILTVVSGFNYIWKNKHVFMEEKVANLDANADSEEVVATTECEEIEQNANKENDDEQ